MTDPSAARIAKAFNRLFFGTHRTLLRGGGAEPLYEPATCTHPARIVHTLDFPASALHEVAHWCLAGQRRRQLRDYGYWYVPGPRDPRQRAAFFSAEAEVQALEAVLASTCGVRFVVSADDFAAAPDELEQFTRVVQERIVARRLGSLPPRAAAFRAALAEEFASEDG
jgi:hypothetical protein